MRRKCLHMFRVGVRLLGERDNVGGRVGAGKRERKQVLAL